MCAVSLILVETSSPGNLGAAMRVAANFGVARLDLVNPRVDLDDPEVARWACGGHERLQVRVHATFEDAAAPYRTLIATVSGRGRHAYPVASPREILAEVERRGIADTALVFGNETSGLGRLDLDRCDVAVRIPTVSEFPVLNITQAIAVLLAYLHMDMDHEATADDEPAREAAVDALMAHLRRSLTTIGFLDPLNPDRILRKIRRLLGRSAVTENEVNILRGICRQMEWAARARPQRHGRSPAPDPDSDC